MTRRASKDELVPAAPSWRRAFPGRPAELAHLRRWLASLLPDAPARDDVVVIAVELATNAIKHTASGTGGYFTVEITRAQRPGSVAVAVADDGTPAGRARPVNHDPLDGHGLGLRVVRALAARSGACGGRHGRRVWAEVPWPESPAPVH